MRIIHKMKGTKEVYLHEIKNDYELTYYIERSVLSSYSKMNWKLIFIFNAYSLQFCPG